MKQNFIRTTDFDTATKLKESGLQLVNEASGVYTFLNRDKTQYSADIDIKKLNFSNQLCV